MKAFLFAAIAGLALATTGAVSAQADTFSTHGIWDTYWVGK